MASSSSSSSFSSSFQRLPSVLHYPLLLSTCLNSSDRTNAVPGNRNPAWYRCLGSSSIKNFYRERVQWAINQRERFLISLVFRCPFNALSPSFSRFYYYKRRRNSWKIEIDHKNELSSRNSWLVDLESLKGEKIEFEKRVEMFVIAIASFPRRQSKYSIFKVVAFERGNNWDVRNRV